jgi:purine-binding chemotaxis protein CheW
MQKHRDEDRNQPFDLPMGGLLSELLASEGIDAGGFEDNCETLPAHAVVAAADPAPPPPAVQCTPEALDIALPGLLSDLLNLAGAAGAVETLLAPLPAPPHEPPAAGDDPDVAPADPVPAQETVISAAAEPPVLAIPGLLPLLSAESGFEPADAPEDQEPAAEDSTPPQPVFEAGKCSPSLVEDELEIDALAETPAGAPPEVEPAPMAVETAAGVDPVAPFPSGAGTPPPQEEPAAVTETCAEWSAAAFEETIAEDDAAAIAETSAEGDAGAGEPAGAVLAAPAPESREPETGDEPEYSPGQAAAALAEAASRLVIEAAARSGESPSAALAGLMDAIGGASPADFDQQPPPESCERYVVFHVGGQSYGLHITCVREVEKAGRVTPVPGAPPMIHGLINLHGEILPLIDPRPLLGLTPGDGAPGGYLVVVHNPVLEMAVAWLVDGLGGMALLDPDRISPPNQGQPDDPAGSGIVSGTAGHRGRRLLLLDGRRLVSEESIEQAAGSWAARPEVGL